MAAGPLPLRTVRNADFREVSLEVGGRTVLRFATAYGFRNIQALMRQMKRGRCEYDYVEVMACPSGTPPLPGPSQAPATKMAHLVPPRLRGSSFSPLLTNSSDLAFLHVALW